MTGGYMQEIKSGIIIINKEKGYTSHDVVNKLRKILNIKKIGHTGTLDPYATGVLPVLVGEGTKFSKYLINHDKIYEVELELGIQTDTADCEGKIVNIESLSDKKICDIKNNINEVFKSFKGKQLQTPPMYSAIKVKGKKLYEYARKGESVEIPKRQIEIYDIKLIDIKTKDVNLINEKLTDIDGPEINTNEAETLDIIFEVSCSKGTYIRSLCEDLAKRLGTIGYMKNLRRIQVGTFNIKDSIKLSDEFSKGKEKYSIIGLEDLLVNKKVLGELPKIFLSEFKLKLFLNGVVLNQNEYEILIHNCDNANNNNASKRNNSNSDGDTDYSNDSNSSDGNNAGNSNTDSSSDGNKIYEQENKSDILALIYSKDTGKFIGTGSLIDGNLKRDIII